MAGSIRTFTIPGGYGVRDGVRWLSGTGETDIFVLDENFGHYKRSVAKLENFCGFSGGQWLRSARNVAYLPDEDNEFEWWGGGHVPSKGAPAR